MHKLRIDHGGFNGGCNSDAVNGKGNPSATVVNYNLYVVHLQKKNHKQSNCTNLFSPQANRCSSKQLLQSPFTVYRHLSALTS
jgi:hypothetical protein